jgi:hypothetical protein
MFLHAALPIAADMKETFFFPNRKMLGINLNPLDNQSLGRMSNWLPTQRPRSAANGAASPSRDRRIRGTQQNHFT